MKKPPARFDSWRLPNGQRVTSRRLALRGALRGGAMTAGELETTTGIPSRIVGALLKVDLAVGRVKHERGTYELVASFKEDVLARIDDAKRLLRANGYAVVHQEAKA